MTPEGTHTNTHTWHVCVPFRTTRTRHVPLHTTTMNCSTTHSYGTHRHVARDTIVRNHCVLTTTQNMTVCSQKIVNLLWKQRRNKTSVISEIHCISLIFPPLFHPKENYLPSRNFPMNSVLNFMGMYYNTYFKVHFVGIILGVTVNLLRFQWQQSKQGKDTTVFDFMISFLGINVYMVQGVVYGFAFSMIIPVTDLIRYMINK